MTSKIGAHRRNEDFRVRHALILAGGISKRPAGSAETWWWIRRTIAGFSSIPPGKLLPRGRGSSIGATDRGPLVQSQKGHGGCAGEDGRAVRYRSAARQNVRSEERRVG